MPSDSAPESEAFIDDAVFAVSFLMSFKPDFAPSGLMFTLICAVLSPIAELYFPSARAAASRMTFQSMCDSQSSPTSATEITPASRLSTSQRRI